MGWSPPGDNAARRRAASPSFYAARRRVEGTPQDRPHAPCIRHAGVREHTSVDPRQQRGRHGAGGFLQGDVFRKFARDQPAPRAQKQPLGQRTRLPRHTDALEVVQLAEQPAARPPEPPTRRRLKLGRVHRTLRRGCRAGRAPPWPPTRFSDGAAASFAQPCDALAHERLVDLVDVEPLADRRAASGSSIHRRGVRGTRAGRRTRQAIPGRGRTTRTRRPPARRCTRRQSSADNQPRRCEYVASSASPMATASPWRRAVAGELFELVRRPMAEIERPAAAHLEGVAALADVRDVHFRAAVDEPSHRRQFARSERRRDAFEELEERRVLDERHLHRLRDTRRATRGRAGFRGSAGR